MPKRFRRRSQCNSLNQRRYSQESLNTESGSSASDEELQMEFETNEDQQPLNFNDKVILKDISDLFELCKSKCPSKYISVLLYMSMRHFGVKWKDCNDFLSELGGLTSQTADK
ncbi:unnamed protein product [Didymodactylos carnosus]|uniref:Uncharacterized protein n=1 Tax=Didymodactylos carnosus TaxID=1234261 RepID=A0A814Y542_9BILA|nr:unnamed protein product [Didymodactylos carnosus]CAF1224540.1 unnamed protein product [Didymodactylos carnosus]CAF3816303.1 unnamed protein product [Didymodactylos carnosus]CAF3987595.1 unnamed protein product [Didymodactylos carnosus]